MKKRFSFLIVLIYLLGVYTSNAQNQSTNIIDELESNTNSSEGVIHIESDPSITALIGKPANQIAKTGNYDYIERNGFRLQIYMGNNPRTARSEAFSRQVSIKSIFPDVETYLNYDTPNWKLLAGDFVSREEATIFKQQLQKEFPQFGKEIYIITDQIKVPIEKIE